MIFPRFYDPGRAGTLYVPDTAAAAEAGHAAGLAAAEEDSERNLLFLIDAQVDFVHEDGALSVPGAVEDTRRTAEWIFRNAASLTAIAASLDSHLPNQIFFPTWWSDERGARPSPFTVIAARDVDEARWRPLFQPEWSVEYVHRLEDDAKKQLMIWPYHAMIGTPGHAITPALSEAISYHAAARRARPIYIHKGDIAESEYYSALEPEVEVPGDPAGRLNEPFLRDVLEYDRVYIAGQAKSHCVLETLKSIVEYLKDDRDAIGRLHVLTNCTSSVRHPEIDFEAMANETYARLAEQGLHLDQA